MPCRKHASTVQYSTVQYSTVQYSTVQYLQEARLRDLVEGGQPLVLGAVTLGDGELLRHLLRHRDVVVDAQLQGLGVVLGGCVQLHGLVELSALQEEVRGLVEQHGVGVPVQGAGDELQRVVLVGGEGEVQRLAQVTRLLVQDHSLDHRV